MSFQTCITYFFLQRTKEQIQKNDVVHTVKVNGVQNNIGLFLYGL